MVLYLIILLLRCNFTFAQVPANGDVKVFAQLVAVEAQEKVAFMKADRAAQEVFEKIEEAMAEEETTFEAERLIEVGSLVGIDGEPILENVNAMEQEIDPRTPQGFGNPFFRKIHVELNQEMDLPPAILEVVAGENITSNSTEVEEEDSSGINLESFVTDSPITHQEHIYFTRKNVENHDLTISWQSHLVRQKHENGTDVDRNTTVRCRHASGKDDVCKETFTEYNSYWEASVDPFPNGICPNPCECLRGIISGAMKQAIAIHKCNKACAQTDNISVIQCADFKTKAERAKQMILIVFNEKAGGWTSGKKVTRNHPLGADVRRFIGTF